MRNIRAELKGGMPTIPVASGWLLVRPLLSSHHECRAFHAGSHQTRRRRHGIRARRPFRVRHCPRRRNHRPRPQPGDLNHDPTAHAEITAIRDACASLETFQLNDCELYTSCEPCPMCLSAIYWAHIPTVYYGNTREDAAAIGFDDDFIYQQVPLAPEKRAIKMSPLLRADALASFQAWAKKTDKVRY